MHTAVLSALTAHSAKSKKDQAARAADLFCGAGGATEAARQAADELGYSLEVDTINHNLRAVESHRANHPTVRHWCEDVSAVSPRAAVPDRKLYLLLAGPSCTEH